MIKYLEDLISDFKLQGNNVNLIMDFFNVGEWLLSFEGIELIVENGALLTAEQRNRFNSLKSYFYE